MSLILDALNRASDDVSPVPGLATQHRVEQVAANRRQYLLWVALSVAVVVIAWLIVERFSAPQSAGDDVVVRVAQPSRHDAVAAPAAADATTASAAAVESVPQTVVEPAPPAVASVSPALQNQEMPAAAVSRARLDAPAQMQVDAAAVQSPAENDAVAELYSNPPPTEEPVMQPDSRTGARQNGAATESAGASREQAIDVDRILREAREEVANASLPDHPVPFLIDLSQQTKDSIPTVYYLRHDYSNNSSLSTVVLNSKTLSVGGSPVSGMKIEEILSDSVVLNYQGTQFRLRALNSWVNL